MHLLGASSILHLEYGGLAERACEIIPEIFGDIARISCQSEQKLHAKLSAEPNATAAQTRTTDGPLVVIANYN